MIDSQVLDSYSYSSNYNDKNIKFESDLKENDKDSKKNDDTSNNDNDEKDARKNIIGEKDMNVCFAFKDKQTILLIYNRHDISNSEFIIEIDAIGVNRHDYEHELEYCVVRLKKTSINNVLENGYQLEKQNWKLTRNFRQLLSFCKQYQMNHLYYNQFVSSPAQFFKQISKFLNIDCVALDENNETLWENVHDTAIMNLNMDNDLFQLRMTKLRKECDYFE